MPQKKTLEVELPATKRLTTDNFIINADGSVTIKEDDLAQLLKANTEKAVADDSVNLVSVGVSVDL